MIVPVLDTSDRTVIALTAIGEADRFPGANSDLAQDLKRTAAIFRIAWVTGMPPSPRSAVAAR